MSAISSGKSLVVKPDWDGVGYELPYYSPGGGDPGGGEPGGDEGEMALAGIVVKLRYYREDAEPVAVNWTGWSKTALGSMAVRKTKILSNAQIYTLGCWDYGDAYESSTYRQVEKLLGLDNHYSFKLVLAGETRKDTTVKILRLHKTYTVKDAIGALYRAFELILKEDLLEVV